MTTMPAPTSRFARFLRPGALMMALGAVLVLAGVVQTTSSTNGGNQSCPSGTVLIAKFKNNHHGYKFDKPHGNENVVTLSHTSDDGAWWSSTQWVYFIIVKGGSASVLYSISPPQVTGSFSNAGLPDDNGHADDHHNHNNDQHHKPAIDNVQFCGLNVPAGTSTTASTSTSSTTSTTHATTTTCGACATTTTHAPTTTTCGECATTTTHVPTTTCECTTTTKHAPPTTCECTTSTTHPHETTTTHPEATTTTAAGTTTSSTEVSGSTLYVSTTTTKHGGTTTTEKHVAGSTVAGQGTSTSFGPTVSSTSVFTSDGGGSLPFTGSSSTPLVALGVVLLATGLTLTLSQARRRERTSG